MSEKDRFMTNISNIIKAETNYFSDSELKTIEDRVLRLPNPTLLSVQTIIEDVGGIGDDFDFELATTLAEKIMEAENTWRPLKK